MSTAIFWEWQGDNVLLMSYNVGGNPGEHMENQTLNDKLWKLWKATKNKEATQEKGPRQVLTQPPPTHHQRSDKLN